MLPGENEDSLLNAVLGITDGAMEIIGWIGTALVIVAYYPQIHHLWVERCAWGISVSTWFIWLAASVLLLAYCLLRRELLLGVVQICNMAAIFMTIVLVQKSDNICEFHRARAERLTKKVR